MKGVKHIESALEVSACRIEHSSNVPGNISAPPHLHSQEVQVALTQVGHTISSVHCVS